MGPKVFGEYIPPTDSEILDFNQLARKVNSETNEASLGEKFTIAWHYEHGIDSKLSNIHKGIRKKDYKMAVELYENIYKTGSMHSDVEEYYFMAIDAAHQIGLLYEKAGNGIKQDYSMAASWYFKGVKLIDESPRLKSLYSKRKISLYIGERDSHITLARLYIEGLGVEQNHERAIKLLSIFKGDRYFLEIPKGVENNKPLKNYLFSKIYSINLSDTSFFINTYGGLNSSDEEGYFLSKKELQRLWKKWIKKAIDLGNIEAIDEYAFNLNKSSMFKYASPINQSEFCDVYKSTIKSLYYYNKAFKLTGNENYLESYNSVLSIILSFIHKFALDSNELKELKKTLKNL